jgi:PleD family two-component response regulator
LRVTEKNNPLIGRSKVLVIDDEYQTRKSLRGLLLAIGCSRIHEASDGSSGIEAIAAVLPDVVLLSWDMQDMQGTEFIRRLRSHRRSMGAGAAMIVLTAHRERSKVLEAMRHGIHEFLLKPVSRAALEARMLSVLSQHAPQAVSDHEGGPESRKLAS